MYYFILYAPASSDRSSRAPSTSHGTSRYRTRDRMSRNDQLPDLSGTPPPSVRAQSEAAQRNRDPSRRRLWKSIPFDQKEHNFPPREQQTIRTPLEYFEDYFDDAFYEKAAYCTNNDYMRQTGWLLRTNFHVVEEDIAPVGNKNSLWKVQPVLNQVKNACEKIEKLPGYYSIDEQMLPFCGLCPKGLRQVIKSKPRPTGLKAFVATTSDDKSLSVGAAVILHLSKSIPPGSCIYFTSIPLLERLSEKGIHGTGTVMMNRIPDKKYINFKKDRKMNRGDTEQFVNNGVVIVHWMDNKSVLAASNCTSADDHIFVKRWDKKENANIDTAHVHRGQVFDLLQFKLHVADGLTNTPDRQGQNKMLLITWKFPKILFQCDVILYQMFKK
ncbi:hypothetical protein ABMA28_003149 [Loxostege sticticalis]|uniref:PiggyBac transposable element-derived protein domain-containing protein n=1 Tax=Loxostege sticticalis TaxID=481309 RepID=A0ABD0SXS4_LOXSC